jgi:hypothetical protein
MPAKSMADKPSPARKSLILLAYAKPQKRYIYLVPCWPCWLAWLAIAKKDCTTLAKHLHYHADARIFQSWQQEYRQPGG